jgi:hypothetical protein
VHTNFRDTSISKSAGHVLLCFSTGYFYVLSTWLNFVEGTDQKRLRGAAAPDLSLRTKNTRTLRTESSILARTRYPRQFNTSQPSSASCKDWKHNCWISSKESATVSTVHSSFAVYGTKPSFVSISGNSNELSTPGVSR